MVNGNYAVKIRTQINGTTIESFLVSFKDRKADIFDYKGVLDFIEKLAGIKQPTKIMEICIER
jgi:predicted nucleotidyltransferase